MPHELEVRIYGKGRAMGMADGIMGRTLNFTFALSIYDMFPKVGSLAGGTTLTFTTSSLTAGSDLGVATYDVHFVQGESQAISKYIAEYYGLEQGVNCKVTTTGEYYVKCVTSAVSGEPHGSRTDYIWSESNDDWSRNSETRDAWLVAEWNQNEIYSRCQRPTLGITANISVVNSTCQFTYGRRYTPLLKLDRSFVIEQYLRERNNFTGLFDSCVGDRILLQQPENMTSEFDWSVIDVDDLLWTINNVSLNDISFVFSTNTSRAMLSGTISNSQRLPTIL